MEGNIEDIEDMENHPLFRLIMHTIQMIPNPDMDILQTTFDEQVKKDIPTCNKFIDSLEEFNITESDIENNLSCSICQEEFKLNDTVYELPCEPLKHYFHIKNETCDGILPWLSNNNTCPMCRYELPISEDNDNDNDNDDNDDNDEENSELPESLQSTNNTTLTPEQIEGLANINLNDIIRNTLIGRNMQNAVVIPNMQFDTVREGFSDMEIDEALRRSLED